MKYSIFIVSLLILTSCFGGDSDEVQKAKDDMLSRDSGQEQYSLDSDLDLSNEETFQEENDTTSEKQGNYYHIRYNTQDESIGLNTFGDLEDISGGVEFDGYVNNSEIDKITVHYKSSDVPYTLQTFNKGDDSFTYRAFRRFDAFGDGLNVYEVKGYIGDEVISSFEVEIYYDVSKSNEDQEDFTREVILDNSTSTTNNNFSFSTFGDLEFPYNENLGEITQSQNILKYSNINNFEININADFQELDCSNIGDHIKEKYSWYYWNTCREFGEGRLLVNVLSLNGNRYNYERHYYINSTGVNGIILLESGFGIDGSNIADKNAEFRDEEFQILEKTDLLFSNIKKQ